MTGSSSLERKLKREIESRKAAERLLEQKSFELYESTQQLSVALKKLELKSKKDLRKFEFEEKVDATLIKFGRTFLSSTFDEAMIASFIEQLTSNSIISAAYLHLDSTKLSSLRRHHFGHLQLRHENTIKTVPNWQGENLHLPIIIDKQTVGELIFSVQLDQIDQSFISKQMELVSDLVHGVIGRHLSLEREVELRKRAEESEKATKEFVAMINHELRTPLNGVLGSAELLSRTQLGEERRHYLNNLTQSGDLLRVIINDLLDFSKMNAGMMEIIDKVFAWEELEKAIMGVFSAKAAEKRIHFSIDKKLGIPEFLVGDLERITQILVNLVGNAIKFTHLGGVVLRVEWINGIAHFEVEDTGIGIPIEAQPSLFDPFVQVDRSAKRSFEGSGLGLAICKNLVDLMQGEISFESEERKGTTFKVSIPLKEGQAQGAAEGELATIERSDLAGRSILVVDDIRMNQVIVTQMLKKLDITPDLKANGKEALEAVKNKEYELIFMDCRMPEMDGYEATMYLRESGFTHPIIALTAGTTIEERQKCIDSGMDDILTKPYTATDIEQIMCKWLEQ
ncbi:ATP-binding protein [Vibrio parahaemolyticus]|uniref:ATP-binding protein n=1 Tax=Vibrio parahaemolyticus TaxID=670 RepID=UPI001121882F|nr:ATP-binding protein [Vibrio parahaemolyticus]MBE4353577.1 response regulator [Vibrio parahaemolyticus]MDF4904614.1 ATP-binding protein [Vibrio parahaemolyticus]TOK68336.1 hybrid sensor histidine kinase/response regulator [Vibrio parahaemolyticus]HCE5102502.1 response regulator [Vibrio parahaemolyticus]HCG5315107.1 response regulator [Vibrio parahaemolyticus]